MFFGADYYPEHWPKERWAADAKLMKEANMNVVRVAEFAWAKLEPTEGHYDFAWLDDAMETLACEGINVVMGTPTATPPKWLMDKHPEIYMKDKFGQPRGFGSRRHYCYNSPIYQEHSARIAAIMAEHYAQNPHVVAWQIDNEFGCQDTGQCYCEDCLAAFKEWLKRKYGTIEAVNAAWGTVFWSQTYRNWDEVILPGYTVCEESDHHFHGHNPGMLLDFYRFSSDSVVNYQKVQLDQIRKVATQPITHNMMGHFPEIDYFDLGKDLDFVCWDNYPKNQWRCSDYRSVAMAHDLMRGIKDKNFWVMEQQSGPCGWSVLGDTPEPGQLRLWTYQAIAHGAEAIVYFRWRTCPFGAEVYWYGILDHDGIPRRRYHEIKQTGQELQILSDWIVDSEVVSHAALIKSYDNLWSHRFQPHSESFDYNNLLISYYKALSNNSVNVDVTSMERDLSKYKVVFMPAFNLIQDEVQTKLEQYVRDGGHLVVTFRSGTRNWENSMRTDTLPGAFRVLSGVEVEEFDALPHGREVKFLGAFGEGTATTWCDVLKCNDATPLAAYGSGYYQGSPAVTVNVYGNGKVYYVGCGLEDDEMDALVALIADSAGITPVLREKIHGVEAVQKEKNGKRYWMLLNHLGHDVSFALEGTYTDLLTGSMASGSVTLSPFGVMVLADASTR